MNLGVGFKSLGDLALAEIHLEDALAHYQQLEYESEEADARVMLAQVYRMSHRLVEALAVCEQCIRMCETHPCERADVGARIEKALVLNLQGRIDEAEALLADTMKLAATRGYEEGVQLVQRGLDDLAQCREETTRSKTRDSTR
jgi:tetratricopeptide (TPR) repeat protein